MLRKLISLPRDCPKVSLVLCAWLLLNLIQAIFTPLLHDEAYYWVFSQKLSFVYFDQMPAVAIFIKAGTLLFKSEIGVRLFTVLLHPITLGGFFILSGKKNPWLFFTIAFSMLAVHFNGIFAAPDSILSFAIMLFLFAYKGFIEKQTTKEGIWLGLAVVVVSLCKYQGILFIIVLALVQIKYFKKFSFWIAIGIAFSALLPLLFLDPVTIRETLQYHLSQRGGTDSILFSVSNLVFSQFIVIGPLISFLVFWALIFYKPQDEFLRSLKKVTWIYFVILILLALKTRVEANWSAPVIGVMLLISVAYYTEKIKTWSWIGGISIISLVGIFILRTYMVWNFLPQQAYQDWRPELHGWKEWAEKVKAVCGNEPVVFWNSYQLPSKYWFYSGQRATCVNNFAYRKNQFSLMSMEKDWQGKTVWLAAGFNHTQNEIVIPAPNGGNTFLKKLEKFYSYPEIRIEPTLPLEFKAGDTLWAPVVISSNDSMGTMMNSPNEFEVAIAWVFIDAEGKTSHGSDIENIRGQKIQGKVHKKVRMIFPQVKGEYSIYFHIRSGGYELAENSKKYKIILK